MQINPKVIDISHYDDVEVIGTDWAGFRKVRAAGYVGVINKVTQGRGILDKSYLRRRPHAVEAGLEWGAYHYFDGSDPIEQADNFLTEAQIDGRTLMALDHETRGVPLDNAREFMEHVQRQTGRYPWLYSGFLIKEQMGNSFDPFWAGIKLWLSHYSANPKWPPCWEKPTLWQFTGEGIGPGPHDVPGVTIAGGCDINSFAGTDGELRAIWAT
ncbi:MAG: glycoside hydrolase family 25 protein [Patescibacteria group bacterium]|nr:glycoside hydrolase family 25 protein [Patescibacteria group bacterium]